MFLNQNTEKPFWANQENRTCQDRDSSEVLKGWLLSPSPHPNILNKGKKWKGGEKTLEWQCLGSWPWRPWFNSGEREQISLGLSFLPFWWSRALSWVPVPPAAGCWLWGSKKGLISSSLFSCFLNSRGFSDIRFSFCSLRMPAACQSDHLFWQNSG